MELSTFITELHANTTLNGVCSIIRQTRQTIFSAIDEKQKFFSALSREKKMMKKKKK